MPPQLSAETADKDKKSFDDKVELGAKAAKAEKSMTQKTLGSFGFAKKAAGPELADKVLKPAMPGRNLGMIAPDGAGVSGETTAACKEKPKTHPKAKAKSALQAAPRPFKSPTVVVLQPFVDDPPPTAAEKKKADRLKEIQEFEVLCDRLEFKIIDVLGD